MSNEIYFDGQKHLSAGDASSSAGLSRDYIARLCRDGRLRGRRIGKNWYVDEGSLQKYLVEQEHAKTIRREQLSDERVREYHGVENKPQDIKLKSESVKSVESALSVSGQIPVTKTLAAHAKHVQEKLKAAAVAQSAKVAHAMPSIAAAPSGVHEAVARTLSHAHVHVPVYTISPATEFLQKFVAMLVAFTMTFGTYAFVDPAYARFAAETTREMAASVAQSLVRVDEVATRAVRAASDATYYAVENPEVALAQVSSATLSFFPDALRTIAKAVNTSVDTFVYNIVFPSDATNSLALTPLDAGFIDTMDPYERAQVIVAQSQQTPVVVSTSTVVTNERVVERIVETERIVASVGGITDADLDTRIAAVEQRLTSLVAGVSTAQSASITNVYQTVAHTNKIDQLSSVDISDSTITGGTLSGTTLSDITFTGSATTTFANGINLADGCFAVDGACITGGGGSVDTSVSNNWTALQIFSGNASSTNFSNFGTAYFGGSATTTIDSSGNLSVAGSSLLRGALTAYNTITAPIFTATSTTAASTFPYASSTALSVSGTAFFPGSGIWNPSGRVGIGTTNPQQPLHVTAGTTYQGILINGNVAPNVSFVRSGTTPEWKVGISGNDSSGFSISTGAAATDLLFLNTAGSVGIGNTSPTYKLHVSGNARFTSFVDASYFVATSTTATSTIASGGLAVGTSTPPSTSLFTVGTSSPLVFVDRISGNFGIGTASPTNGKLQITGGNAPSQLAITTSDWVSGSAGSVLFVASGASTGNTYFGLSAQSSGAGAWNNLVLQSGGGSVGIGNVSPWTTLAVTGGLGVTASSTIGDGTQAGGLTISGGATTTGNLLVQGLLGVGAASSDAKFHVSGSDPWFNLQNTDSGGKKWGFLAGDSGNTPAGALFFQNRTDGVNAFIVSPTGEIGFGKTSPTFTGIFNIYNEHDIAKPVIVGSLHTGSSADLLQLNSSSGSGGDLLAVKSTGSVGIGTTTPGSKLDVFGTSAAFDTSGDFRLFLNRAGTGNVGSMIFTTGGAGTGTGWAEIGQTGNNGDLHFKANATAGSYATRMLIQGSTGNVGIGTTSPWAKLSVQGSGTGTGILTEFFDSASTTRFRILDNGLGYFNGTFGIGTTTPYHILTVASSTGPQLALSDGLGSNLWTLRNIGSTFYLATSTHSSTSTVAALSFSASTGAATFGSPSTTTFSGGIQSTLLNITGSATSTFAGGVQLTSGCFLLPSGQCAGTGSGSSGGGGGGNTLIGTYATSTVGTSSVVFTGDPGSAPSFSGGTLTLPSDTSYIEVEVWGGGGGGGGGGNGGNGGVGGTTCFGSNSVACSSPHLSATGGGGGSGSNGPAASGGSGSGGEVNLVGGAGGLTLGIDADGGETQDLYAVGGAGGNGARGGGGGAGTTAAGGAGNAFGGGGAGGGINDLNNVWSGGGGGGGGYAYELVGSPTGTFYFTVGSGGSAGNAGTGGAGGAGGAGGFAVKVYTNRTVGTASSTVAFHVHRNGSATTTVSDTVLVVDWTTETYDTNNNFDLTTNRFTPTVAGKYIVVASVGCTNTTNNCQAAVRKNGVAIANGPYRSGGADAAQVTTIVDMNGTSDYLEAAVLSTGTAVDGSAVYTYFSGSLLASGGSAPAGGNGNIQFNYGGVMAASSTLTWDTVNARFGIGTSSPWAKLSVHALSGETNTMLFEIASSTASATSSLFAVTNTGNVGVGTTTPSTKLTVYSNVASVDGVTVTNANSNGQSTYTVHSDTATGYFRAYGSGVGYGLGGNTSFGSNTSLVLFTNGNVASGGSDSIQFRTGGYESSQERMRITSTGNVGIGTTTPGTKLDVYNTSSGATADQLYLTNAASATSTASRLSFRALDVTGTGTTTSAITSILQQNFGGLGKGDLVFSTLQSGALTEVMRATSAGFFGVGTTSPYRKFSVTAAAANPQVAISYNDSTVASLQVDSTGDLTIHTSNKNILLSDDNLLVCASGCPTSPTGAGKLYVETAAGIGTTTPAAKLTIETQDSSTNFIQVASTTAQSLFVINANGNVGVGTSTPFAKFAVGAGGAITTVERSLSDGATVAINWLEGNQQKVTLGGNRTITFSNFIAGQILRLVVCQDGTGSRTLTWPAVVRWQGGSAPTLTTTANQCDLVSFVATNATSSLVVFGAAATGFR